MTRTENLNRYPLTKLNSYLRIILFALQGNIICNAQQTTHTNVHDSLSAERIIFEDDFSRDTIGKFPSRWQIMTNSDSINVKNRQYLVVQNENGRHSLNYNRNTELCIEPDINSPSYFMDSSTLEFDFVLKNYRSLISLNFCSSRSKKFTHPNYIFSIAARDDGSVIVYNSGSVSPYATSPGNPRLNIWHHFRITFNQGNIKCYVDQYRVDAIFSTGYFPAGFGMCFSGIASISKFRITNAKVNYQIEKILTDNTFITHAIQFDINKSIIKPESMDFISQLAQFLKTNPTVNLEIDGHTDNDGDAGQNIVLSLTRANEVRFKLMDLGIDAKRLTTKGFGASRPLQPNNTAEGRANNRRVEFTKL